MSIIKLWNCKIVKTCDCLNKTRPSHLRVKCKLFDLWEVLKGLHMFKVLRLRSLQFDNCSKVLSLTIAQKCSVWHLLGVLSGQPSAVVQVNFKRKQRPTKWQCRFRTTSSTSSIHKPHKHEPTKQYILCLWPLKCTQLFFYWDCILNTMSSWGEGWKYQFSN